MAETGYMLRTEFQEFHKQFEARMDAANDRQDARLAELEKKTDDLLDVNVSIKELSVNMKSMLEEQKSQSKRLTEIENKDAKKWRQISSYVITTVIGLVIGFVFNYAIG